MRLDFFGREGYITNYFIIRKILVNQWFKTF